MSTAKNGNAYTLTLKVEALRRHAEGESKKKLMRRLNVGSPRTLSRWFKDPRVLRAAGLSVEDCRNLGVHYMGPYDPAEVLPDHSGEPVRVETAPLEEQDLEVEALKPKRSPKGGRPSKLEDPELVKRLRHGLHLVLPLSILADYVGVTLPTLTSWLRDAYSDKDTPGARLGKLIREARAEGIIRCHEAILNGDPGAKGSQFLLGRVHRDNYAERVEQSVEVFDPLAEMDDQELDELINSEGG